MPTQDAIVAYLLQHDLVAPARLIEGDLVVLDATRRNANFMVVSANGPSYLVKMGIGPERQASVAHEAAMYGLLEAQVGARISRYLPRCHSYSPDEHLLVLELLPDAQKLEDYHQRRGRFPLHLAAALGDALAAIHQMRYPNTPGRVLPTRPAPWMLLIHRPDLALYYHSSFANLALISTVQRFPELGKLLDDLRAEWRPVSFVHYDIKGENLLVTRPVGSTARRLKIVDWEMAGMGDPCWDVGSMFGSYLGFWLRSIPITGANPPDRFLELARYPLERIQPSLRRFWNTYAAHMGLTDNSYLEYLLRSVRFAAVRLIQTAFEQEQVADHLSGNSICFLQLAYNILQRPWDAALYLLGIPLSNAESEL